MATQVLNEQELYKLNKSEIFGRLGFITYSIAHTLGAKQVNESTIDLGRLLGVSIVNGITILGTTKYPKIILEQNNGKYILTVSKKDGFVDELTFVADNVNLGTNSKKELFLTIM